MTDETVNLQDRRDDDSAEDDSKRAVARSTVQFPYVDIDGAIDVARAIYEKDGTGGTAQQIAAWMDQSPTSGAFRLRMSAARIYGLTDAETGRTIITPLGRRILDPAAARRARVDAFLNVELYSKIFERFDGFQLPPPVALERAMAELGVTPKVTDRARQVFERAATQAGFFENGQDRLVMPGKLGGEITSDEKPPAHTDAVNGGGGNGEGGRGSGGGGAGTPTHLDPLIVALLSKVPADKVWPIDARAKWLRALAINLSFVYDDDSDEERDVVVTVQQDRGQ